MAIDSCEQATALRSAASPAADAAPGRRPTDPAVPISSSRLLGGRSSVTIDHEGVCYVLRATRAGKLILTK